MAKKKLKLSYQNTINLNDVFEFSININLQILTF